MQFKYQSDFDSLTAQCPPSDYLNILTPAFRWVFDDLKNPNSFKPQYYRNPRRFLNQIDAEKCKAMSLSLFVSVETARDRFHALREMLGVRVHQILGSQIASGNLTPDDGVHGDMDQKGHFSFHPAANSQFEDSFTIIETL